ncbi:MAG: asparagine synthase (glutamine-hydrolyzing) [Planctomycetes bacterium]|nr:asparagine synthase (glutamine-hydrolyzing) [Planctomycetota bacterium]
MDDDRLLKAMCASLTHRGPDDEGSFTAPRVGLAMRRLAIIDVGGGHQPIANEAGNVHVIFNGEIYNYQELTARLKQRGHRFSTSSDTETLVHLYEDYGLGFVNELRGMFSIALWDARRQRLVLARDPIGEKPLYYQHRDGVLLFGSEIKAILQAGFPRAVDSQAVCEFLAVSYVPAPRTFFEGIQKMPPGHLLTYEGGHVHVQRYRQRDPISRSELPFDAACDQLADFLSDTVGLCLKSDVEVGAFLSGGLDSSLLVALMRHHSARVQTFSVGYEGLATGFNELGYARRVARDLGTQHHELILGAQSTIELLPRILWHYDEPHGEPTSILVYLLCEFTQKRVKVALGGTGGDEIFFGYPRHAAIRMLQYYRVVPRWLRERVIERVVSSWPESTRGSRFAKRAKRFVKGARLAPDEAYLSWVSLLDSETRASLLDGRLKTAASDPSGEAFLCAHLTHAKRGTLLERAADLDVGGYLPEYQLAYMDRMSMAHGLEVRSPFCDYRLVDFVTQLPTAYRLRGTRSKHILKQIATRWIPKEIAERKKVGFDSPIGLWARQQLREFISNFLSPEHVKQSGLLDPQAVRAVLADHVSGRRDYSLQIWSLLALEAWYRMYIEDRVTDAREYTLRDLRGATPATIVRRASASGGAGGRNGRLPARAHVRPASLRQIAMRKRLWERAPKRLRNYLSPAVALLPPSVFLGRNFRHWARLVERSERWSAERIQEYQLRQVRQICQLAYERTSFYREHFDRAGVAPADLTSLQDLRRLPPIDRTTVDQHLDRMCTVSPHLEGVDEISTGGTYGRPLRFYMGADRSAIEYAYLQACWRRVGYTPGTSLAVFRGRVVDADGTGLRHEYDPILRHHYYSTFHMNDENMRRYLEHVRTLGPCFLHVYPSSVAMLARFVERAGIDPPRNIRGVIAESEIVYPRQRQLVERVFGCRYFSCYGHSEKLVLAAECEHSEVYHVCPTYGFFELLDERDNPVTEPGRRGEIVGTGFINRVVPFIRYRTGDHATYLGDRCNACGRAHTLITDIQGHRTQELLVASDGSLISWTALNMHDDTFRNVRQFRFFQDVPGRTILRIVPTGGFGEGDRLRIQQNMDRKLGGRVDVTLELTECIPLSPRGKNIYVEQRVTEIRSGVQDGL